jgi:hypothetical protein
MWKVFTLFKPAELEEQLNTIEREGFTVHTLHISKSDGAWWIATLVVRRDLRCNEMGL